jgi:hypothetical protein
MSKNIKKPANGYISAKNGLFKSQKMAQKIQKIPKNTVEFTGGIYHTFFNFLKTPKIFPNFQLFKNQKFSTFQKTW